MSALLPTLLLPLLPLQDADPAERRVALPCAEGWEASLVLDRGDVGIWTVKAFPVFPQYTGPQVVGLDDEGRLWILVSYSGKWTPFSAVDDRGWLGGLDHGDVDPRFEGAELYAGSETGNVYQVLAYPNGATDHRLIATFPGREVHTVVACDLASETPGGDVLVFTNPGGMARLSPSGPHGTFETTWVETFPGRVRDAVVLPDGSIATVSRTGELALLTFAEGGEHEWRVVHRSPVGKGRVCAAPGADADRILLYTTQDDGVVLRHERRDGTWVTEPVHYGHEGPRGIAAGRFDADASLEQVAIFGYSGEVELLTRGEGGWSVETIFQARDRGHWLSPIEIDDRNGTHELVASGYGGRIVLLSRPAGYGRSDGAAVTPRRDPSKR